MYDLWALVYHGMCVEIRSRALTKCNFALQQFPVYVLPKVEYQGCYGVEALTESELCRFWTESLLHSNCSFYVGHIDAFTSKLFMLEEITSEELKEKLAALKISSLFNILQHILKKLCRLVGQEFLPGTTGIQFPWKPKAVACLFSKLKMKEWLGIKGK